MKYKKSNKDSRRRGRPRSELSRRAIVEATISILESEGYENLKIMDVARTAGVGKQTIYRWWRSKAELVIEAVLEETAKHIKVPCTGSLTEDLRQLIRASCHRLRSTSSGAIIVGLLMAGRRDAATLKLFREQFIETRRDVIRSIFKKYQSRREIKPDINTELVMDLIFGAIWYRLLMEHAPLDDPFADELIDYITFLLLP